MRVAVTIHFDSASGLAYQKQPGRQKRTTDRQEWWDARLALFEKLVLPCLVNQTLVSFDVWGMFHKRDLERSKGMRMLFTENGFIVNHKQQRGLIRHYGDVELPVCIVLLDSDDIYALDALEMFANAPLKAGDVAYCDTGYILHTETGVLALYQGITTPPPFFGMVYPPEAFKSQRAWDNYRDKAGFVTYHHRLSHHKRRHVMLPWKFCHTMNGHNTQALIHDIQRVDYRTKGVVTDDARRKEILASFGQS